jgi:hypothetical protein
VCLLRRAVFVVANTACVISLTACGSNGGSAPDLAKLKNSRQPYYYVGRSFDGLRLSDVLP